MLTTLSILSLEQGRIWTEASATPKPAEQPKAERAPERRPLRTLRLQSLLAIFRPARV